ncbi:MAG: EAL domain-containing protein [Ruminococcus sp.]|uniref:EAL domain-containing protein n=1 Tax=Ruminococcus sp. TaxID=41978 RepID=UPI0025CF237B|nr:EAL domain-containing protein [Ruminococcus sp.]MCR5600752.1 EAL domain-containing protein [Ruminococcus sp.]
MKYSVEDIKLAFHNNELTAYYQPQYDTINGQMTSAEALVRCIKPDGTVISPSFFIPVAEESDLITEIDWYVTEIVCQTLVKQKMMPRFPISVNYSRRHIREENFAEKLTAIVDKYDLPHQLIEVEITESAMIGNEDKLLDWIMSIRNSGFKVAIDDFGSGLSSLQFVKDVPADVLKIDKSLLSHNCEDEKERIVLESIFTFAHRLNINTVAEGVETKEQLGFLRSCDCNRIQGYLYARPMSEEKYIKLCCEHKVVEEATDILQSQSAAGAMSLLINAIFKRYPLVIFTNLTRNSFYMMAYDNFTSTSCPSAGIFDELIVHGANSMHPDDREKFAATFNRTKLIEDYNSGIRTLRLITRQLGDDGIYRRVETVDYFVKSNYSDDVLAITLCENLPDDQETIEAINADIKNITETHVDEIMEVIKKHLCLNNLL